jgi:chemotaxis protein MotA
MHVLIGIIGLAAVLAYTALAGHSSQAFAGLLYWPAVVLLVLGPWFMAITSYSFEELAGCARATLRAFKFRAGRSREALFGELSRFALEVRKRRSAEAMSIADSASHDLFRQLAPLVLKKYSPSQINELAATASYCQASALRRSEDVLNTLARTAPAAGLVGTVLGLITLLKDLSAFEQLGPSMALALLCTLYGLVLANAVYTPLARLIRSYTTVQVEESKLLARALALIVEEKPMADLRKLFELAGGTRGSSAEPAPDLALGA